MLIINNTRYVLFNFIFVVFNKRSNSPRVITTTTVVSMHNGSLKKSTLQSAAFFFM